MTATPGRGPAACARDCGTCEDCTRTDHYVARPCHCPTCSTAAELDPDEALADLLDSLAFDREVNCEVDGRTWGEALAVADAVLGGEQR